jgi:Ca-activated chloride channel family protein
MKKGQVLIVALALAVLVVIAVVAKGGSDGEADEVSMPDDAIEVTFAYSPEKEPLLPDLVRRFNASRTEVDGRPVFVTATSVASGDAQARIAAGRLKPTVWSPASSLWGRMLNFAADKEYVPDENPSIVRTPLVIAMWEPMARALGWPDKQVSWADVLKLARAKDGWSAVGHPEFGRFKLVHTNPDFSTAGLSSVVAEYYAATGKKEGLRTSDLTGKARADVRAIERSIVHYGDTTIFIADQLREKGQAYASAVALEEATLVELNRDRGDRPRLVALYPEEGTFYSDNPFIVLRAPWVNDQQREGAERFQRFLADEVDAKTAAQAGFRPADLDAEPADPLNAEHGVDRSQPQRVLGLPEPRVLEAIRKHWRADRKPANVYLVFDTSGSMAEEGRMANAKDGLRTFLQQVAPQDRIGLMRFAGRTRELIPLSTFRSNGPRLRKAIAGLTPDGGTAVRDATAEAFEKLRKLVARSEDERINAVVLLTDGEDTDSRRSVQQVVRLLGGQGDSTTQVRVFTIAYSSGALGSKQMLEDFANASGGKPYSGNTDDIESVYRSISSFF